MAKAFAPSFSAALLDFTSGYDLISGNVKIAAMSASYTYSAAHNFHDDLTNIITTSANLTGKDATDGYFSFDSPFSLGSPAGGSTITQCWLYIDSGSSATSPLVYYWDEDATTTPLSIATDGTAVNLVVPAGPPAGLFRV